MKVVITGGHHTSALPVIKELKKQNEDVEIFWFGHKHSLLGSKAETLEYKDITSLGIKFFNLNAGKFYKTYNLFRLIKIPWGFIQAFFLLIKVKPNVILSFGGYLAAPTVFSGWILGISSITHEQTVVTGYANKFISKFAKKILISWDQSRKYFPKDKVILSGLPLREQIYLSESSEFLIDNNLPTIYVTGGKTGSHKINNVILENMVSLLSKANIIHQCGDQSSTGDYEGLSNMYRKIQDKVSGRYFLKKFVTNSEIGEVFSKADLVISRSGAHIVKELMSLKKLALLIPISWVSHNEQYKNAKLLEQQGLAEILEEKNLKKNFNIVVERMLENLNKYRIEKEEKLQNKKKPEKIIVKQLLKAAKNEKN